MRWRRRSRATPARFGHGAIEGVAAPEAANNAGAQTSFIPLLTLGIPGNAIMALMVGAMMIQGIQPGPQVMTEQPQLFWGVIASMWLGNLMLIVLNLPLIGLWVVAAARALPADVSGDRAVLLHRHLFGRQHCVRYLGDAAVRRARRVLHKVGAEPAPFMLGFILGPLMEENFRRAMYLSRGDPLVFVERPISALLLLMSLGAAGDSRAAGGEAEARGGVQGIITSRLPRRRSACTALNSSMRFFSMMIVCVPSASITKRLPGALTSSGNSVCAM